MVVIARVEIREELGLSLWEKRFSGLSIVIWGYLALDIIQQLDFVHLTMIASLVVSQLGLDVKEGHN
jgi:hypothetical protein